MSEVFKSENRHLATCPENETDLPSIAGAIDGPIVDWFRVERVNKLSGWIRRICSRFGGLEYHASRWELASCQEPPAVLELDSTKPVVLVQVRSLLPMGVKFFTSFPACPLLLPSLVLQIASSSSALDHGALETKPLSRSSLGFDTAPSG
eukprot:6439087-Amphidinium_carterae.1